MRSARIVSPGRYEVFEEKTPAPCDGKVLVRLLKAAICGSDLPYFSRTFDPSNYPLPPGYPGHECCGVVESSDCEGFSKGDLVMYYPVFLEAYKEYHLADPGRLQKLPAGHDLDRLLMTQLLGAVSHCAFRLDSPYKKTVVVMGQGPVGLLFTSLMKRLGAKTVIAADLMDYRLEAARRMGADFVIDTARGEVEKSVGEITGGMMADIVIDASGQSTGVINSCFDAARHNGQVAFFGIALEEAPRLNFNVFFRKELRMVASVGPDLSIDYPYALDMIVKGAIDVGPLLTHRMPFEKIHDAFVMAVNRTDGVIKIILDF